MHIKMIFETIRMHIIIIIILYINAFIFMSQLNSDTLLYFKFNKSLKTPYTLRMCN